MNNEQVPSWVWAVLIGAHVMAFVWSFITDVWGFPDSGRYLQAAENLWREGVLYARSWPRELPQGQAVQEFTIRPIGYPLALLLLGGLLKSPIPVLLFQNLLSLLNIGLVLRWWAQIARPESRYWKGAVLVVFTFPAQLIYANAIMSEMLLQSAALGLVYYGGRLTEFARPKHAVGMATAAVLALLLKPVFYPLALVVAGAGAVLAWRVKSVPLAAIGCIPLLVVGLYMAWNMQRTGYFHFSSIAEINLLHYNAAGVVRQVDGPKAEDVWVVGVLQEANQQTDFAARQMLIRERATAVMREYPYVYTRQHIRGMGAMFLDPGRFDISQFLGMAPLTNGGLSVRLQSGGLFGAIMRLPVALLVILGAVLAANLARVVLAARGFLALRRSAALLRRGRWVALGLLLYVALMTGPLGAARFLVPVWPLLLGLALVGLKGPVLLQVEEAAPMGKDQRQS